MAKTQVSEWDTVAANNTDINSIPIDGAVTVPSQLDNITREMMAQIKTFSTTVVITTASTDNAIARFNGTAGAIQNSGVTIDDSNNVTAVGFKTSSGQVNRTNDTGAMFVTGGTDANNGASIWLYGDSHATDSNDILLTVGAGLPRYQWDNSVARHTFFGGASDEVVRILTGGMTVTGSITNSSYRSTGTVEIAAGGGSIAFRPNGTGVTTGQADIDTSGNMVVRGTITATG